MRRKIENKISVSVDGVDLTKLKHIEFYIRQCSTFFQYEPLVIDSSTMVITIPKNDADRLAMGYVELQFAFTDDEGNDDASDILSVNVKDLLKYGGYNADQDESQ